MKLTIHHRRTPSPSERLGRRMLCTDLATNTALSVPCSGHKHRSFSAMQWPQTPLFQCHAVATNTALSVPCSGHKHSSFSAMQWPQTQLFQCHAVATNTALSVPCSGHKHRSFSAMQWPQTQLFQCHAVGKILLEINHGAGDTEPSDDPACPQGVN